MNRNSKKSSPADELVRIKRMLIAMFIVMLLMLSGTVAVMAYALRDIKFDNMNYVDLKIKDIKVIRGKDGLSIVGKVGPQGEQGLPGVSGQDGKDGKDGKDGSNGAIGPAGPIGPVGPQGPQGEKGETGAQGPQGPQGEPGKTVYLRTNPLTGEQECRYHGDEEWQPAVECEG